MGEEEMTKQDIVNDANEIKEILKDRVPKDVDRLELLVERNRSVPAIQQILKDDYDAKMTHSGFGAPGCYCHRAPPCSRCVEWCGDCKKWVEDSSYLEDDNFCKCEKQLECHHGDRPCSESH
jgi:hypothetical protein